MAVKTAPGRCFQRWLCLKDCDGSALLLLSEIQCLRDCDNCALLCFHICQCLSDCNDCALSVFSDIGNGVAVKQRVEFECHSPESQ
eukprot:2057151-Lingulodinium_polyedra.AAC.2